MCRYMNMHVCVHCVHVCPCVCAPQCVTRCKLYVCEHQARACGGALSGGAVCMCVCACACVQGTCMGEALSRDVS